MSNTYDAARFGVNKIVAGFPTSAALNGTAAAAVISSRLCPYKTQINLATVRFPVGGTAATNQLLIGTATPSGGTLGTVAYIGTMTLGTQANETDAQFTITGTVQAGDVVVLSSQGTSAAVYTAGVDLWGVELFNNL